MLSPGVWGGSDALRAERLPESCDPNLQCLSAHRREADGQVARFVSSRTGCRRQQRLRGWIPRLCSWCRMVSGHSSPLPITSVLHAGPHDGERSVSDWVSVRFPASGWMEWPELPGTSRPHPTSRPSWPYRCKQGLCWSVPAHRVHTRCPRRARGPSDRPAQRLQHTKRCR